MFEGLFDFIDKIIGKSDDAFEKGYFYYLILAGGILLIVTFIVVVYFLIKGYAVHEPDIPIEKRAIMEQGNAFCNEKGFDTWEWINETNNSFRCRNSLDENISIEQFYLPEN